MLVLERKPNQVVVVKANGVEIRVMITSVRGNSVKIGFEAPQEVRIVREELLNGK